MKKNVLYFLCLALITIFLSFASKLILNTDELLISTLGEKWSREQIIEFLDFRSKWVWLNYAIIPVLLVIKISVIAVVLDIGMLFYDEKLKYEKLFNIVVKAEYVFLLVILIKTTWFYFFKEDYTLEELQTFSPLSVLSIVGFNEIRPWYIYPLQVINLLEFTYWIVMAYLIDKTLNVPKGKNFGIRIVAISYGSALLIWVITIMFLILNIS